jgi:hypothetical protein
MSPVGQEHRSVRLPSAAGEQTGTQFFCVLIDKERAAEHAREVDYFKPS